jgi:amylosucrase
MLDEPMPSVIDRSYRRLLPRLEARMRKTRSSRQAEWQDFLTRLDEHFPRLFSLLYRVYGDQYDFFYHLEELLSALAQSWLERPEVLKTLDQAREHDPRWFQSNQMLGGVIYVDLFAGDLAGVRASLPYFKELGLTYLHLMPLFKVPEPENDGGYAVTSYREVNPALGSMQDLTALADELRAAGISLVVDFVFNHTAHEHAWALKARAGDPDYQAFYMMYPDRVWPDHYEATLREIFPDEHPGAFTYFAEIDQWVWTTFHSYQWDLNYANPAVFNAMAQEMLALANAGVEVLRLDAVAFIWKKLGTACENLPEAHVLIQAFNAAARIAAPALLFKSEAIVHPDEVARYIDPRECQLSYNPLLMALLWEALATRSVDLLSASLRDRFQIPAACAWVNYVRCHDDIGWTFSDEDAAGVGINGFGHRRFLNDFYTGRFAGSFARGLPFQENPKTGDCRISGTCASLAGLEKALREETAAEADLAIRRILLIHTIIMIVGGIPLLYLGDEIGMLNDYTFRANPAKTHDSRWVHRPKADAARYALRDQAGTPEGRIFSGLRRIARARKEHPVFAGGEMQVVDAGAAQVFAFMRSRAGERALVLANFSEQPQVIPANLLRLYGLGYQFTDLLSGRAVAGEDLPLAAYEVVCLQISEPT